MNLTVQIGGAPDKRSIPASLLHDIFPGAQRRCKVAERRFSKSRPPINDRICEIDECGRVAGAHGMCNMHLMRLRRHGSPHIYNPRNSTRLGPEPTCRAEGCDKKGVAAKGLCQGHYVRLKKYGEEGLGGPLGRQNINNPQRRVDGYMTRKDPNHPLAGKGNGHVLIHREVMSEKLGRPIRKDELVHHINGKRDDNRPENLELFYKGHPPGQRPEDLVAWAYEIIALYADEIKPKLKLVVSQ